jgi:hypothetical protein
MPPRLEIDPAKIAYYEKAGWEAYYDRNWPRAFWLLVQLNRTQFQMSWPQAFSAALDTVRASVAFVPLERSNVPKATAYIQKFYEKAGRSLGQKADAAALARLEMDYWVVHRRLAIARKQNPDDGNLEPMIVSLANLHAALFGSTAERMRRSAELRAKAAEAVDLITSKRSTDVAGDWRRVEAYLRQAYEAVKRDAG